MTRRLAPALLAGLILALVPSASLAATRTINFDDVTAPGAFSATEPLTDRYAALGVTFAGPEAGAGGAILNQSGMFGVSGHSAPNFLAFNTGAAYPSTGKNATGPETITFATPIHSATIKAGQGTGGTATVTAFDGATPVSSSFRTSAPALAPLSVTAAHITSIRLEFTGNAIVWDDFVWGTAPVSPNDAFTTAANTALTVPAPGVLGNDTDADGDALTATLRRAPANGLVELRPDGSFTYTPRSGFSGPDSFDYRANDGTGNGNDATVTITVQPPPPPPPSQIPSTVTNSWLVFPKFTRATRLRVNNVLAGSRIRVTCKTKRKKQQKKRCAKSRTINSASAKTRVNLLKPYRKKKLPAGTKLTITITTPGAIGKRFTFTVRKRKVPRLQVRCIPPGGKAGKCT